ncbi:MAG: hypothetical protein ACJAY0_000526 [Thalassolituus sp.]|jgi:hypothetical protein
MKWNFKVKPQVLKVGLPFLVFLFIQILNDFMSLLPDDYQGVLWFAWPLIGIPSFLIATSIHLTSGTMMQRWSEMLFFWILFIPFTTVMYFFRELMDTSPGGDRVVFVYAIMIYAITIPAWLPFIVFWTWLSTRK